MVDSQELLQQLKAFDESKAGVKGIIDDGITKIPSIFIRPPDDPSAEDTPSSGKPTDPHRVSIPVVDLGDVAGRPAKVIQDVRQAAESVGFFHVVNHGIPNRVLEEMLEGARGFHELPREVKADYYSRDPMRKVKFLSSYNLSKATWRDSLFCNMAPEPLDPQELPEVCRDITMEYSDQIHKVGVTLFELLSQALGLKFDHLTGLDCAKERLITSHYYPPCPEPERTIGTVEHTDGTFITILLQDHIGGLQVLVENKWIDVLPLRGALIVNIGDLLQIISNDKFKSVIHRVLSKKEGPRISVGCFFGNILLQNSSSKYEPIKELTSKENPPVYRTITVKDYIAELHKKEINVVTALEALKTNNYVLSYIWANDERVQEALSIRNGTITDWKRCNKSLAYDNNIVSVVSYHQELIGRGYRSLIYSGDHDMLIPYVGTITWIRYLNLTTVDGWRPWYVDGQVAGFSEKYSNLVSDGLTFSTVKGGGHTAPEYMPKQCLEMLDRRLSYYPL